MIKPQDVLSRLNVLLGERDAYVVTDVGQHQMWVAQYVGFDRPKRLMTSGGMGTMGYGLPAAVGVQTAHPESLVVCVSGDGSFQMNSQEMMTAVQENLPIKVLLMNNNALGMVRQWQELYYANRTASSRPDIQPDFVKLAEAYGWKGLSCAVPDRLEAALREWLESPGACLLDCRVDDTANCFPMIPVGKGHHEMVLGR